MYKSKLHTVLALSLGLFLSSTLLGQEASRYERIIDAYQSHPLDTAGWELWVNNHYRAQIDPQSTLIYKDFRQSPGGYHYSFVHSFGSVILEGSGLKLTLSKAGKVISVMNYLSNASYSPAVSSRWRIPPKQLNTFIQDQIWDHYQLDTCLIEHESRLVPVWKIVTWSEDGSKSESIFLDATTGKEIKRVDRALYYYGRQDTNAVARVFLPDPCTRGKVRYGELFEDDDDAHSPVFDLLMDTVLLKDITFERDSFYLKGPYVELEDISPRNIAPAVSTDGSFYFTREESGFEDVMVYYHIDRYQRYIQSLGFDNLQNKPLRVDSHGLGFSDQSQFVPQGDRSYILYGEGGVDDAEDADVIIHEYIHALSYAASGNDQMSCERRGLDEGYADYFAAGYSRDIDEYDWENLFNWDGHNPFHSGRMMVSNEQYPLAFCSKIANVNAWGEIWASAAMRIRNEIGEEPADRIFLQALYGNINDMTFRDAVALVLEADSLLYEGQHSDWINFYFCQQGIIADGGCLSVNSKPTISHNDGSIKIHTNSQEHSLLFTWEPSFISDTHPVTVYAYDLMGRKVDEVILDARNKWSKKIFFPTGIYAYYATRLNQRVDYGKIFVP